MQEARDITVDVGMPSPQNNLDTKLYRVYFFVQEQASPPLDRRTRKRLATRQAISDAATRLFMEHGFDQVTVDEIAEAADVGRMTVFNHFPHKEDMFFDREDEVREMVSAAIHGRDEGASPVTALRLLAHRCIEDRNPLLPLFGAPLRFVATALASEALKARARQMSSEFTNVLAAMLARSVDRPADDPVAHLLAGLLVATWSVAFFEGYNVADTGGDAAAAGRVFLPLIDRGFLAAAAAAAGTPYVEAGPHRR
ncbi:TetR/AcrR family transcriptional regulator [Methylobacterium sp. E-005]|uniref:TetR/AcrR family transcriptional regulator n=1 Tax=Methylobacterium sp. E-005 TaxID=2836549 RepID=UPI001FB8D521|nr:TetR/AcrR family transcriptional regulator [Methylobacterium sp. E-005]MCJ2085343.1 TetR/AcrR family transcriptional regulator [Methylobacterium sp. E-005]